MSCFVSEGNEQAKMMDFGKLIIWLISGDDLAPKDMNGFSDPYCIIGFTNNLSLEIKKTKDMYLGDKIKSKTKKKTLNPVWDQKLVVKVFSNNSKTIHGLRIVSWDKDVGKKDDWLGQIVIESKKLESGKIIEFNEKLLPGEGKKRKEVKGTIKFKCLFLPNKIERVYLDGHYIFNEIDEKVLATLVPSKVSHGFDSKQGKRKTMEDTHLIMEQVKFNTENHKKVESMSLFCVFDGHGGSHCSQVAEKKFAEIFLNFLNDEKLCSPIHSDNWKDILKNVIVSSINSLDKDLVSECGKIGDESGSTMTVVVLVQIDGKRKLVSANLGDSEAIVGKRIVSGWESILLTEKHTAKEKTEIERIEKLDGFVNNGRLFGEIEVTRSLGDLKYKIPVNDKDFVSKDPFFSFLDLDVSNEFLVLACDGLWGYIPFTEVLEFIDNSVEQKKSLKDISAGLVNEVLDFRSGKDNVTVIVVSLPYKK